jgi:hypothetical protein
MKNPLPWATGLLMICIGTLWAQVQPVPARNATIVPQQRSGELTRFSLDFAGGTPKALVAAIQQAMGKPLNAIVPDEYADMKIPPLKMSNVNVQELFSALEQASRKTQVYGTGPYYGSGLPGSFQQVTTSYGFQQGPGALTDDSIWCFYATKPPTPPIGTGDTKVVRFYSLSPYLRATSGDRHLTVDDITTAIETGWKMVGETSPPKISFHKDTNLLIAVGEPNKLETIDAALKALAPQASSAAPGKAAAPKPADSPRSAESSNSGSE